MEQRRALPCRQENDPRLPLATVLALAPLLDPLQIVGDAGGRECLEGDCVSIVDRLLDPSRQIGKRADIVGLGAAAGKRSTYEDGGENAGESNTAPNPQYASGTPHGKRSSGWIRSHTTPNGGTHGMIVHEIGRVIPDEVDLWPGDAAPELVNRASLESGSAYVLHTMIFSAHCGTHLDAPAHFVEGGADVAGIPIATLIGPAEVVTLERPGPIGVETIRQAIASPPARVLFRCGGAEANAPFWVDPDAARLLVSQGVRLVGTTCMSIDAPDCADFPSHRLLLGEGCSILENLNLEGVASGRYFLLCAPLRWKGAEASPVRPLLIEGLEWASAEP